MNPAYIKDIPGFEEYLRECLLFLESPECRAEMPEEQRIKERKEVTEMFRLVLEEKEKRVLEEKEKRPRTR